MVAGLAARLDIPVYLVRYRRAPEHAYPAAVDDALAAYRGLVESGHHPQDVAIVGDSSGGGLALALAQRLTREGLDAPGVLGLMSPWLDLTLEHAEAAPGRRDPLLTLGMLRRWADSYARSANRTLAGLSPIFGELKGLPPIVVHTGTDDLMYWDAQRLEELAGRVGTVVHRHVHDRAPHVPQLMAERTAQSSYAPDELACDLTFSWQTRGQWPH
jgi:acetyl esterase/lipase